MPQLSSRRSTVARQILVLQVLVVVVVVVGAVTLAYADARRSQINSARDRALAVGHSPTNESAVLGLSGTLIGPLAKGAGVLITEDHGTFRVDPLDP